MFLQEAKFERVKLCYTGRFHIPLGTADLFMTQAIENCELSATNSDFAAAPLVNVSMGT